MGKLITRVAVAEMLGVSVDTIERMEGRGTLPQPLKLSPRTVRHRLSDIEAYLQNRQTNPTTRA